VANGPTAVHEFRDPHETLLNPTALVVSDGCWILVITHLRPFHRSAARLDKVPQLSSQPLVSASCANPTAAHAVADRHETLSNAVVVMPGPPEAGASALA
jgi:hypothetical protein